jgi:hypothetical protein
MAFLNLPTMYLVRSIINYNGATSTKSWQKPKRQKALVHYREQYIEILERFEAQEMSPVNKLESLRDSLLDEEATSRGCLMVNSALEFGTEDDQVTREIELMFAEAEQILEKIVIKGQEQQLITTFGGHRPFPIG